ncbi:anion transporter [Methanogenium sp. S4BF]|uniref:SLC13 family permease n=1 Tax=Methanogenium sp. S4BF TaxID=1789226 RepID=UPI0024168B3F|nr:SLC13 family permease [Methanogenium sp. S4BF]WFN35619.1 anion transporter [Methanogenium sp. S4BF]
MNQAVIVAVILALVLGLIALRNIGGIRLAIWQIMLGGALAVLILGQISPLDALYAINTDVMIFLFGMFVVGEAIQESGLLITLSSRLFRHEMSMDLFILLLIAVTGFFSAVLMNDTVAIIGTPFVLYLAKKFNISPVMLLLVLAFSVTTGSVVSPIGNPQNLLIALEGGLENPFLTFILYLAVPSAAGLLLVYGAMKVFYPREFGKCVLSSPAPEAAGDSALTRPALLSLVLIFLLIGLRVLLVFLETGITIPLTAIAVCAALPVLVFSPKRVHIVRHIDWETLVFFAALFVLMQSVWDTGFFQQSMASAAYPVTGVPVIFTLGIIVSQFISNVPFVALALPLITGGGASDAALMALAAGSTLAGNLLILGAASNVIIIQNAEKEGMSIRFLEFARIGIPLTFAQTLVYWAWFLFMPV